MFVCVSSISLAGKPARLSALSLRNRHLRSLWRYIFGSIQHSLTSVRPYVLKPVHSPLRDLHNLHAIEFHVCDQDESPRVSWWSVWKHSSLEPIRFSDWLLPSSQEWKTLSCICLFNKLLAIKECTWDSRRMKHLQGKSYSYVK